MSSTPNVKADYTYSSLNLDLTLTNISSGATSYSWDFGDSTSSNSASLTHSYKHYGTFRVKLTAMNGSKIDTIGHTIVISKMETIIQIKTRFGEMIMWLYDQTPKHKANFIKLADSGYFDSTTFHRVIPNFVSQGGDPNSKDADTTNDGNGGPPYTIPAEIKSSLKHTYGAVGAARLGDAQNPSRASNGSQFYIVNAKAGTSFLDGAYTVFGMIIKGVDVAVTMANQPQDPTNNRPYKDIRMDVNTMRLTRAQILAQYGYVVK